jgi:aryl carrier-like protein
MEPVAENVVGEIYIAGDCLAEGYLNREGMTGEVFIDHPFERGRKIYRSGDLGRRLPEGVLEYVGRRDEQVKYHGHRVELGEIRSLLNLHAQIRDSVVMVKKDGHGLDALVAYYVSRRELEVKEIREYLLENLAEETLPSVYVHLKRMPLTLNGKVDYQALPSLEEARGRIRGSGEGPRTPVEELLARIWEETLGVERVGVDDNFFELGGHSLLAVRVMARLRQAGMQVDVRALFARPTIAELASGMGSSESLVEVPPNLIPNINTELFDGSENVELRL